MVKLGAAVTVTATIVDSLNVPEVPVMVTLTGPPAVAAEVAVSVMALDPVVAGLGLNAAVTPLGRPEAEKVTLPVNPLTGVTVMESVMLVLSWVTDKVDAAGEIVKLGATGLTVTTVA
jgi:hypothetical protein